ncbi:tetratricopeptide repeat protein [Clostridium sp. M14]|uniref:tetratricopeptide repeat protein n=1 Tax=Clostridium sp. M14 TaxID=2716311 RepID=UPI0013EEC975|nr:tetratricopeptide repeat protein [Clostridium sp. M14]MBZ9690123.1 tetratricopeptide repeat protein [Clostridium sp. M14]
MIKIKLPGSQKLKLTILIILLAITLIILGFEGINNRKKSDFINKQSIENAELIHGDSANLDKEVNEDKNNKIENEEEYKLYNEAYNLFFSGEYDKSIEKSNEIISEFPSSAKIAKSYNESFEAGMKDIDKALELEPKYGYAVFNKALTYELYGKLDEALLWYNKNLEIENYIWTYYGIASIYGRRGDVQNTVKYLSKAIEIDEVVKKEARDEADFNPVRDSKEFKDLINN